MSRIGKRVLTIPAGVTVDVNDHKVTVKGSKGELSLDVIKTLNMKVHKSIQALPEMQGRCGGNTRKT